MCDDDADIGAALQRTGKDEIDDGARRVKHVFDNKRRRAQVRLRGRFAMRRMNKYDGVAPVELVKNRVEQRISQVSIIYAGKKADAIEVQDVERIGDFFQRTVDIRQGNQSKRSESRRMFQRHSCLEFVACAGYFAQSMHVLQNHSRRQRGDGRPYLPLIHRLQLCFDIRNLDRHRVVRKLRRNDMMMHVNAPVFLLIAVHGLAILSFRPKAI